jgi:hypothetical protein
MEPPDLPALPSEWKRDVNVRTGWRVRDLAIELHAEKAVLRGQATTVFTRHLAYQVARDLLPHLSLENSIVVEQPQEVLYGMPLH